jgi:hypothetical protein
MRRCFGGAFADAKLAGCASSYTDRVHSAMLLL